MAAQNVYYKKGTLHSKYTIPMHSHIVYILCLSNALFTREPNTNIRLLKGAVRIVLLVLKPTAVVVHLCSKMYSRVSLHTLEQTRQSP